jgi:hypothetical protein
LRLEKAVRLKKSAGPIKIPLKEEAAEGHEAQRRAISIITQNINM